MVCFVDDGIEASGSKTTEFLELEGSNKKHF
jgi:hypothetical protein